MVLESLSRPVFDLPWWVIVMSLWDLAWRAVAIWKSTRRNQPVWSVIFLFLQTVGILPILYIFLFSEMGKKKVSGKKKTFKKKR